MKRMTALLLSLLLCVSLLPAALAADDWKLVDAEEGFSFVDRLVGLNESTTLSVAVRGEAGELTYQWYEASGTFLGGTIYSPIEGETGASFTTPPVTEFAQYQCTATDAAGETAGVYYDLAVDNGLTAIDTSSGESYVEVGCEPGSDLEMSVSVSADDMTGVTYQWFIQNSVTYTRTKIEDATGTSYTAKNITDADTYIFAATDQYGTEVTVTYLVSIDSGLRVWAADSPYQLDWSSERYEKGSQPTLTVAAEACEGAGPFTYEWYAYKWVVEEDGFSYWDQIHEPIKGADGPSFTPPAVTARAQYGCAVFDRYGNCRSVTFELGVENNFTADAEKHELSAPLGEEVTMKVAASADEGPITYEWYRGLDREERIEGADGPSLTVKAETQTDYVCIVSDPFESEPVNFHVSVENGLTAYAAGTEQENVQLHVAEGETTTMTVDARADAGDLSWQWFCYETEEGYDWGSFVPVEGANTASLESKPVTGETSYQCEVTDIYGATVSVYFELYVDDGFSVTPVGDYIDQSAPLYPGMQGLFNVTFHCVCAKPGDTVTLACEASSRSDSMTLEWRLFDPASEESSPIEGAVNSVTAENVQADAIYILRAENRYGEIAYLYYKIIVSADAPATDPLDANGDGAVTLPDAAVFLAKGGADSALKAAQILQKAVRG